MQLNWNHQILQADMESENSGNKLADTMVIWENKLIEKINWLSQRYILRDIMCKTDLLSELGLFTCDTHLFYTPQIAQAMCDSRG